MKQRENAAENANKTLEQLRNDAKCAIMELTIEEREKLLEMLMGGCCDE